MFWIELLIVLAIIFVGVRLVDRFWHLPVELEC